MQGPTSSLTLAGSVMTTPKLSMRNQHWQQQTRGLINAGAYISTACGHLYIPLLETPFLLSCTIHREPPLVKNLPTPLLIIIQDPSAHIPDMQGVSIHDPMHGCTCRYIFEYSRLSLIRSPLGPCSLARRASPPSPLYGRRTGPKLMYICRWNSTGRSQYFKWTAHTHLTLPRVNFAHTRLTETTPTLIIITIG